MKGSHILSTGSAVPNISIDNVSLSKTLNTSDEWISTRTGIKQRRILGKSQSITDLAAEASNKALSNGLLQATDIDLIILATSSQHDLFGSASKLQAIIGAKNAIAFDITAACSGFVIALATATQFIETGTYKNVLVVGADILSRWVDWSDRRTCILFGDGAGAAIVQTDTGNKNDILSFQLNTNGLASNHLSIPYRKNYSNTGSIHYSSGRYSYLTMNGKEVYKFAVSQVPESIKKCLEKADICTKDISWLLLHQANQRILETVALKLGIPSHKIISNIQYYGNTSAASIPLALDEAFQSGHICNGDIIVIAGFGAGLTWGTTIIKWNVIE
uniref:Beta-ketoacyl-acyl carrier protein synthase III n=1 Tax=Nemalion vermiculare TaxID=935621 RepID=UPI00257EF1FA|nr:Beta-ketoacyl-acyl carrier protein synthase III [Nemalion vermiculare]WGV34340.1 Beta-ketoacyl-acyl carrier protein synthase III [Nemalion vermiculare]